MSSPANGATPPSKLNTIIGFGHVLRQYVFPDFGSPTMIVVIASGLRSFAFGI
jgi:hypothetical protein